MESAASARSERLVSRSVEQTKRFGKRLSKLLQGGEIIGLVGELGAGKTSFVRGLAEGLGVGKEGWIRSPTFTLINEYHGRLPIYHIDLYRIENRQALESLNLREYLYDDDGVSLIEWFERLPADEVDEYLEINIVHRAGREREIVFRAHGERYEKILQVLSGH
ncbi:MAG: tRNA (adenosine(37)-N6)-threonylcarbamoyltransferase complex ATPase subunit type 1 TsaE [Deltaproteobacteria bacterium]|nr:tRNA (adenosine(37)-N6)-threonylcarbamoyltransferase complex ATPase subunit type 1 TsaE [Deltaproteobacteria bacterium]